MNPKYAIALGVVIVILQIGGMLVGHFFPSTYASVEWKNTSPADIDYIVLEPVEFRNYAQDLTISKSIAIKVFDTVTNLSAQLNGKYDWIDFGGGGQHQTRRCLQMRVETKDKQEYRFFLRFGNGSRKSYIQYSEIHKESYQEFADEQDLYGHEESSVVLSDIILKTLEENNITWRPAYQDKNLGGFFQPSYPEWTIQKKDSQN